MKMKILFSLALTGMLALLAGCYSTADGHMKMGMPFAKDKITSRYERTIAQLSSATREVLTRNGKLLSENVVSNSFQAKVNERNVWVKLEQVDPKITEVVVQARSKAGGTDIDLASEVSKQIALQLSATP